MEHQAFERRIIEHRVGDFESAVRKLGMICCPYCGEVRQISSIGHTRWLCAVCHHTFVLVAIRNIA